MVKFTKPTGFTRKLCECFSYSWEEGQGDKGDKGTRGTRGQGGQGDKGTRGTRSSHDRREWGLGAGDKGDKGTRGQGRITTNYQLPLTVNY
ncbi:MAG: hypothetical protein CLLPBCKN_008292 [Chroococcidiopsis cubana SAG 39.79]|uniref:hypothetical protein n=1 Tax=Chroococcidiopsis cubana TaxID=171392 RepID=UPI002AC6ADD5|nr:hypothetical protein [Chroococcidiopsis cubana]MDZ4878854.1 hypothetical protein [Chroococcidiopsis cubana SAG 39.79]